jgi:hypothetical protein
MPNTIPRRPFVGDLEIIVARRGVAARMVVHQYDLAALFLIEFLKISLGCTIVASRVPIETSSLPVT